jgi:putative transposase
VRRNFTAEGPNRLWLADITEYPTRERRLYLCVIRRLVEPDRGWFSDRRMKARLVVAALGVAVVRRGEVAGCIRHADRVS